MTLNRPLVIKYEKLFGSEICDVTKFASGDLSFNQFIGRFNSQQLSVAAVQPRISRLWNDLYAGRAFITALIHLKGIKVPYIRLVLGIDKLTDGAAEAEEALVRVEQRLQMELERIARTNYDSNLLRYEDLELHLLDAISSIVKLIRKLSLLKRIRRLPR